MPFNARRKKYKPKRRRPRRAYRRFNNNPSRSIVRGVSGFADRQLVKMKYAQALSFTGITVTTSVQDFRGNSIYDPDATGAGGQPISHDEWAVFYGRYFVTACAIKIIITPKTTNCMVTLRASAANTSSALMSTELQQPRVKSTTVSSTEGKTKVLKGYITTRAALGANKFRVYDDDTSAAFSASPAYGWHWLIHVQNPDETTGCACDMQVLMTYYVIMYQRNILGTS